jgi:hypothetical protein
VLLLVERADAHWLLLDGTEQIRRRERRRLVLLSPRCTPPLCRMPTCPHADVAQADSAPIACGVRRRGPLGPFIRRLAALQITSMHRPCTPAPQPHAVKSGEPPPKRITPALPRPAGARKPPPRLPRAQSPPDGVGMATNATRHTGPSPPPRASMRTAGVIRSAPA